MIFERKSLKKLCQTFSNLCFGIGMQALMLEIDDMDEQWRLASKKFQTLLPELSGEDVDKLMKTIKKEKGLMNEFIKGN